MKLNEAIDKLNEAEKVLYALGHAQSVLYTDGDTVAPKNSWKGRGKALAYLSELTYKQLVNPETGEILETILQHRDETDEVTFRRAEVMKESYDQLHVLPMEEYVAYQELTNEAGAVWHDAKEKSDWAMFAPYLEKMIAARCRFASLKTMDSTCFDQICVLYTSPGIFKLDKLIYTINIRPVGSNDKNFWLFCGYFRSFDDLNIILYPLKSHLND